MLWVRTIRHIDQWSGKSILCYFLIFLFCSFPLNVSESWVSRRRGTPCVCHFLFSFLFDWIVSIYLKTFLCLIDISYFENAKNLPCVRHFSFYFHFYFLLLSVCLETCDFDVLLIHISMFVRCNCTKLNVVIGGVSMQDLPRFIVP